MSFANYKKTKTDLTKLTKTIEDYAEGGKNKFKDSRFWTPTIDKAGNGSATIRFLPATDEDDLPWGQFHDHNFSENGNYFVYNCPTTLGKSCPVCEANKPLWKAKDEGDKEAEKQVGQRKRKVHYVSNIMVLKDKESPDNEGKTFLYKYGVKIFDKIKLQLKPKDEDDTPVNVFDFWGGADFRIEIKNVGGYRNYDDSNFRAPSALLKGDDAKLEEVYNVLHKLNTFTAENQFKSYDELEKLFDTVLNGPAKAVKKKAEDLFPDVEKSQEAKPVKVKESTKKVDEDTPPWEEAVKKPAKATKSKAKKEAVVEKTEESVEIEADDELNYYDELADRD